MHICTSIYTDILAVDYLSDGRTLNTTFWLASGLNFSASIYNQAFRKITYGMLMLIPIQRQDIMGRIMIFM